MAGVVLQLLRFVRKAPHSTCDNNFQVKCSVYPKCVLLGCVMRCMLA